MIARWDARHLSGKVTGIDSCALTNRMKVLQKRGKHHLKRERSLGRGQTPTALLKLLQLLIAQLLYGHHHCFKSSLQTLPKDHVIWLSPQSNAVLVFISRQCNFSNI